MIAVVTSSGCCVSSYCGYCCRGHVCAVLYLLSRRLRILKGPFGANQSNSTSTPQLYPPDGAAGASSDMDSNEAVSRAGPTTFTLADAIAPGTDVLDRLKNERQAAKGGTKHTGSSGSNSNGVMHRSQLMHLVSSSATTPTPENPYEFGPDEILLADELRLRSGGGGGVEQLGNDRGGWNQAVESGELHGRSRGADVVKSFSSPAWRSNLSTQVASVQLGLCFLHVCVRRYFAWLSRCAHSSANCFTLSLPSNIYQRVPVRFAPNNLRICYVTCTLQRAMPYYSYGAIGVT